jgi:hypothetical protein
MQPLNQHFSFWTSKQTALYIAHCPRFFPGPRHYGFLIARMDFTNNWFQDVRPAPQ